ncbi:MAG TPA: DPP IV N-terminal domain-containing protein [Longimicrobiales bacterium]|nr:DPP IV N-terminal domain-containing protein [Longimicrobiales bacterium]
MKVALKRRATRFNLALLALLPAVLPAQDRLKTYPGYEQYQRMQSQLRSALKSGALVRVEWESPTSFVYLSDGKRWRYDLKVGQATEAAAPPADSVRNGRNGGAPERGRQYGSATAPDGKLKAYYQDRNLWLSGVDGSGAQAITTEGSEKDRTKYGSASWVYGEELDQNTAIWWSPGSDQVAYYGMNEKPVPDYYLQMDQTRLYSKFDIEAYPKAGENNPVVDIWVYDVATRKKTKLDLRNGQPFENQVIGYYAYRVGWTPDGSEVTVNRTNRRQNIMEFSACSPATGKCRVIVREEWPTGWVENSPTMQYLKDNQRFIWASERTGFRNYYLYDLSGKLLATLTNHAFEVGAIVQVDEATNTLYYMARSGDNHMKLQLHRVGLDGKNDRRLTDPAYHHTAFVAPDGKHFVDIAQRHDVAPFTQLVDRNGQVLAELAKSDLTNFNRLGLKPVELFTFKAADGVTELHGMLHKPSNFDPNRKYPVLVSVYGGPATNGARELFTLPSPLTEYGFLVVSLDGRNAGGRGKRFLDAIYQKLGTVEIDDQAAGIRALASRPYVDASRVGIFGTSYGGYASALALLRYPDLFHAAVASSPVTDWRHYDTIYTERYMWTPQENGAGYDAGSAMKYVNNLRGRLMLYYGTADNNVHPNNSMELIQALQRAGKSFEVQVGPDRGHTGVHSDRMMEFFIENLMLKFRPIS